MLTQRIIPRTLPPMLRSVRLVDGCGNSRLVNLSSDAIAAEWTCPVTGRAVTFVPYGLQTAVTDGLARPIWVPQAAMRSGAYTFGRMRPATPPILDQQSEAWWDELYRSAPPLPSAIAEALLRGRDEDDDTDSWEIL